MHAAIDAAVDQVTDPVQMIRDAIVAFLTFFEQHPQFIELLIQERAYFPNRETPTFFATDPKQCERSEMLRSLIRAGVLRDLPVEQITDTLGHYLYGAIFVNYFAGRKRTLSEQAQKLTDIVFYGILAPRKEEQK